MRELIPDGAELRIVKTRRRILSLLDLGIASIFPLTQHFALEREKEYYDVYDEVNHTNLLVHIFYRFAIISFGYYVSLEEIPVLSSFHIFVCSEVAAECVDHSYTSV